MLILLSRISQACYDIHLFLSCSLYVLCIPALFGCRKLLSILRIFAHLPENLKAGQVYSTGLSHKCPFLFTFSGEGAFTAGGNIRKLLHELLLSFSGSSLMVFVCRKRSPAVSCRPVSYTHLFLQHLVPFVHQKGIGRPVGPSHPATELIQL